MPSFMRPASQSVSSTTAWLSKFRFLFPPKSRLKSPNGADVRSISASSGKLRPCHRRCSPRRRSLTLRPRWPLPENRPFFPSRLRARTQAKDTCKCCQALCNRARDVFDKDSQPRPDRDQARLEDVRDRCRFHRVRAQEFSSCLAESRGIPEFPERAENRSERLTSY